MDKFAFLTPEFIKKHCRPCGIQCNRKIFPWKYLGWSDEEYMANEMRWAHGGVIQKDRQLDLLGVVRAQETLLIERHEYVTNRDRALRPFHTPKGDQLELF